MKPQLRRIVLENDTPAGRAFDLAIQALIVASMVAFAVDTLPDLSPGTRSLLATLEVVTVALFTVEYLLRLVLSERPLRFVCSFFGLVDLAAILPFYLTTGLDLRSLRAVRLLRLFRILKLGRYNAAIERLRTAFRLIRAELVLFLTAAALLIYVSAVGIYFFEHQAQPEKFVSVFDALWWALGTLTTVGYGDIYPITTGGRLFTGVVLFVGLGIVAIPSGLVASALSQARAVESGTSNPPATPAPAHREA